MNKQYEVIFLYSILAGLEKQENIEFELAGGGFSKRNSLKSKKIMKLDQNIIGRVLLGLLFSFAFVVAASGHAQEAASFYKGKTITFVVFTSPGGGYDMYARMIAPFLEKETGANVAVQNIVGGEGYIALRHVYNAKPDGLNILIPAASTVILN